MDARIYIVTHKSGSFPQQAGYVPIFAGKALHQEAADMLGDDTGDNISALNRQFCELTALYWIWKNCRAEVVGLVHYRRYFSPPDPSTAALVYAGKPILAVETLPELMQPENRIILPTPQGFGNKRVLGLFTTKRTARSQYGKAHFARDWRELEQIVRLHHPEYAAAFKKVAGSTEISFCNMFIARRSFVDAYCMWLFDILFKLQKRLDIGSYDPYQQRIFGFMAERLLNVYVYRHAADLDIRHLDITFLE